MARVSLVVAVEQGSPGELPRVDRMREALELAGHQVDVLEVVVGGRVSERLASLSSKKKCKTGPVAALMEALRQCEGEILLVLDAGMDYDVEDLPRMVEPLANGLAEVAIASRFAEGRRRRIWTGRVVRPLTGTSDPLSGLIGLTRSALLETEAGPAPIGRKLSIELLLKLRGDWAEVPVQAPAGRRMVQPGLEDLRQLKRLSDMRFGNLSRLLQFCVVGASGMVVDLSIYALLHSWILVGTPLQERKISLFGESEPIAMALVVSAALAIAFALTWNFTLNRYMTFSYAREGSLPRQFLTYALSNALAIAVSFTLRLGLPAYVRFFHDHKLAAALVGIVLATGLSFSMSRWLVFRPQAVLGGSQRRSSALNQVEAETTRAR